MASNSSSIQIDDQRMESATLKEKLVDHYKHGPSDESKCGLFTRCLFAFQALTQLYVTLNYLIPVVFEGLPPWALYCLKVLACYICAIGMANWLCVICYRNAYVPSRDRPDIDIHVFNYDNHLPDRFGHNLSLQQQQQAGGINRHQHHSNGHVVVDVSEKGGLPWHYCKRCDREVPPRTHHCKFCKTCILRRDHHCHLVGCCIGHWNQRYFVILAAYGILVGYVGAYMTITYLRQQYVEGDSLWDYFLPCTFFLWVTGKVSGLQLLLVFHAHMLCMFGPICNIYFLSQFSIIVQGKTLHEVAKKKNIKISSTVSDNFRLVFGDYWMVNFLFPAQIIFKQGNNGLHFDGVKMGPETSSKESTKKARD